MKTHLFHINDVIAQNDTTVLRLEKQYELLSKYFGLNSYETHYIESNFGDSQESGKQVIHLISSLIKQEWEQKKTVIMVNNASRAKHKNSGNAKGSQCLWTTWKGRNDIHIVGVDDEVFATLKPYINDIIIIHDIQIEKAVHKDISQGSQFRSLEFWPTVQIFFQTHKGVTLPEKHHGTIYHSNKNASLSYEYAVKNESNILNDYHNELFTIKYDQKTNNIVLHNNIKTVLAENPLLNIAKYQIIGQHKKFEKDRGLGDHKAENTTERNNFKQSLKKNEICIIDRDKFGNTKCVSPYMNGIYDLVKEMNFTLNEKIKISWNEGKDTAYIVQSISEKTGEKCIRNGSSRGPNGEILIELNYSIGNEKKIRESITKLAIGTILTLESA